MKFISLKTLRSLCIDLIIFLIPVALLWNALPFILRILSPFIAGYLLFLAANPLNKRLKNILPGGICAFISLFLISAAVFFILRALILHLAAEITDFTQGSGMLYSDAIPFIRGKMAAVRNGKEYSELFTTLIEAFRSQLTEALTVLSSAIFGFAKNIPSMLISVFASVLTAFFLLKDDSFIRLSLLKFFGDKACQRFSAIKKSFLDVTVSYLKAQLIVESIIFAVLLSGFYYLKINYALLLAFFTAIIDAVPILGTGTVLIPLSLINFFSGHLVSGWGLLILYGLAILTRQLCEPKIIGNKLGIHPLLTVFALYTGMKLFGVAGLILGPITAIFIKNLLSAKDL